MRSKLPNIARPATGNKDSVEQKERAALIQIRGSRFVVERGVVRNSSKDGVQVTIVEGEARDIRDGVIRDIVGYDNVRDHISISGFGIRDGKAVDAPVFLKNCRNVTVQTVTLEELTAKAEAIRIEDSADVRLRNIFPGTAAREPGGVAIRFRLTSPGAFGHLRIQDVITTGAARRIVLERAEAAGALDSYRVYYDPALVDDRIKGANGRIIPE